MESELYKMEFIGYQGKSYFSGLIEAEAGFECVGDYPQKRRKWR